PSIFNAIANKFKTSINSMEGFVKDKVFAPIKEGFVGEKGLINQIKESGLFDSGKNQMKKMSDYLFGEKRQFDDGSMKRTGGFLGEFGDNMLDVGSAIKYQFTGKGYKNRAGETFGDSKEAFMPSMKSMFTGVKSSVTKYLMGDKDAERDADKKGILTTVFNTVQTGANNWREAIFGPSDKKKRDKSLKETLEVVKKKAPKAAALGVAGGLAGGLLASGSGLLGAILLPGAMGPILGMGLGMATQSESFMTRVFGDKDVDGKRIGGIISRNTQDFFKKNKNVIIGGGALGLLKPMLGFGLLPSFFLPGGPVGAAALGVAGAMAYRSNAVQNVLFGKMDADTGVRMGGLFNKAANGMKVKGKKFKDLIPNVLAGGTAGAGLAAVIGQFGLLGAMLTPLGPIGGALMGAAGGIALSSEKFKNALFGKWDDETGAREGGVLGKFSNWFNMEVKSPFSTELRQINLNMKKWFTTSIANPFKDAIAPMKKAFSNMTESLQKFFVDGWNSFKDKIGETFEKNIGKPFGEFMNKHIMTPMKKIMKGMVYGPAKIFGAIASAPFKGLSFVGNRLEKGQMRKGIKDYRQQISENSEMNFFQKVNAKYFDRKAIKEAQFSEAGADYYKEEQERKSKRDAEQSAAWAAQQALIDADKNKLARGQALAAKHGYEGVIEVPDGKGGTRKINLEQFYNLSTKSRSMRHFMANNKDGVSLYNRNFEDLLGVSLQQLMNSGDNVTADSLSRAQRKRLSKAIQSGKKGNALLRHFGISVKTETAPVADAEIATEATPATVVNETRQTTEAVKTGTDSIVQATRESSSKRAEQLTTLGTKIVEAVKEALPASRPRTIKGSYKNPKGGATNAVATTETGEVIFMGNPSSPSAVINGGSMNSNVTSGSQPSMYDLVFKISQDVRSISMDTKGQLDGVGSNVFKLRKTVQMFLDVDDNDITGSNNKDRMGFWGRFRRAIFKPFEQIKVKIQSIGQLIKDKVTNTINTVIVKPIKKVQDIMRSTFDYLKKGMTAILDAGVSAGKAIAGAAKFIVVDIPKTILSTVKTAADGIVKGIGKVFTGLMDFSGAVIAGIGDMSKSVISGIGKLFKGATEVVKGFGSMIGSVFAGVGKMIKSTVTGLGNVAKGIVETIIPTAKLFKEKVTKGLLTIAEMPFKIAAGVRNGISAAVDITKDLVSSTAKFISEKYTAMMDGLAKVGEVAKNALNGVVDVTKKIGIGIWNVIKKPFSLIGQGINAVKGTQKPKEVIIKGGYLEGIKHTIKVTKGDADDADFALLSSTLGDVDPAKGIKDKQSKRMVNLF
ncbi:MAG TPA: hypothetical protein VNU45_12740, partial [Rummeliibacillus sp.]|nr:hypothetical protein [Rummeliibacillus sp.]